MACLEVKLWSRELWEFNVVHEGIAFEQQAHSVDRQERTCRQLVVLSFTLLSFTVGYVEADLK